MRDNELIVRRTTESDWQSVRALRLEMLRDTPEAFGETVESALGRSELDWRLRGARGSAAETISLAAISDGEWVGTMGAYVPDRATGPMLVGVYVTPRMRGEQAGVTDALLGAIEDWARERAATLALHVHERNDRARGFYAKRGFSETGRTFPYLLNPADRELEMRKALRR